eukprot:14756733-Alexandrium_andersonii.AAC.1
MHAGTQAGRHASRRAGRHAGTQAFAQDYGVSAGTQVRPKRPTGRTAVCSMHHVCSHVAQRLQPAVSYTHLTLPTICSV